MTYTVAILARMILFVGVGACMLLPFFIHAETTDEVAALRAKIIELEEKLKEARAEVLAWKARAEVLAGTPRPNVHDTFQKKRIERLLRLGMSGEDVQALQEALAKEPGIYPEGLITGFYGPLTEAAVRRLKERHKINDEEVFGPRMLAFLNQWLRGEGVVSIPPAAFVVRPHDKRDPRVEELLRHIREGKRGEELKKIRSNDDADKNSVDD